MGCPSAEFSGKQQSNIPWRNWSERVSGGVGTYFEPDSLPDLAHVIMRASVEGHHLRVVGSGWSYEDIAYSPDWMVSLVRLKNPLDYIIPTALNPNWANRRASNGDEVLFHVEAGAKVADVNDMLAERGLALPTLGGSNGQAIGGVISTSTHGADIDLPPFPDLVMAMHLVTAEGREVWVERASDSITRDVPLARALSCKDTEIIRNDELFNAMVVGFGRFGIVYSYVLRVRSAFRLAEYTVRISRDAFMDLARTGLTDGTFLRPLLDALPLPPDELSVLDVENPRHLMVLFDSMNTNLCYIRRRWMTENADDLNNENNANALCGLGAAGVFSAIVKPAFEVLKITPPWSLQPGWPLVVDLAWGRILTSLSSDPHMPVGVLIALTLNQLWEINAGAFIPHLAAKQFDDEFGPSKTEGRRGRSDFILSGFREQSLQTCYKANSIEPIFNAHEGNYLDFLDWLVEQGKSYRQSGYYSLRWSASSQAMLSMYNVEDSHAVAIEVTSLRYLNDSEVWMAQVEKEAIAHGGRPHWGQQNRLTAEQVENMYGEQLERWRSALTALIGGGQIFSTVHTVQRGLEPTSPDALPTLFGRKSSEFVGAAIAPSLALLLSSE